MASGCELGFRGSGLGFRLGFKLRLLRNILHDLVPSIIIVHGGHAGINRARVHRKNIVIWDVMKEFVVEQEFNEP